MTLGCMYVPESYLEPWAAGGPLEVLQGSQQRGLPKTRLNGCYRIPDPFVADPI